MNHFWMATVFPSPSHSDCFKTREEAYDFVYRRGRHQKYLLCKYVKCESGDAGAVPVLLGWMGRDRKIVPNWTLEVSSKLIHEGWAVSEGYYKKEK